MRDAMRDGFLLARTSIPRESAMTARQSYSAPPLRQVCSLFRHPHWCIHRSKYRGPFAGPLVHTRCAQPLGSSPPLAMPPKDAKDAAPPAETEEAAPPAVDAPPAEPPFTITVTVKVSDAILPQRFNSAAILGRMGTRFSVWQRATYESRREGAGRATAIALPGVAWCRH